MRPFIPILTLVSFAACAPTPNGSEALYTIDAHDEPLPIPPSIELIVGFLTPGMSTGATITGVPEDASVYLVSDHALKVIKDMVRERNRKAEKDEARAENRELIPSEALPDDVEEEE